MRCHVEKRGELSANPDTQRILVTYNEALHSALLRNAAQVSAASSNLRQLYCDTTNSVHAAEV